MTGTVRGPAAHGRRLPGRIGAVVALALAGATIDGVATASQAGQTRDTAPEDASVATTILRHLDLNSFPNSAGPRRQAALHTPSDYGLTRTESFDDGWAQAGEPDDGWLMSVVVLDGRARVRMICFNDTGCKGATYRATQALRVTLDPSGRWKKPCRSATRSAARTTPPPGPIHPRRRRLAPIASMPGRQVASCRRRPPHVVRLVARRAFART